MKKWVNSPININGYVVIKDYGRIDNQRRGIVKCKHCGNEFETNLYHVHNRLSCGCVKSKKMNQLPKEINGFKIVRDLGRSTTRKAIVICKVCGNQYEAQAYYLKDRKHCGCLRGKELKCSYRKTHPRLLRIYKGMKSRCYNKKDRCFHLYGAKGIAMDDQWIECVDDFFNWSLNNGYKDDLSIDRIDGLKGYSPDNCRWVTTKDQARNTSRIKMSLEIAFEIRSNINRYSIAEFAREYNVCRATISNIIKNKSWI